MIWHCLRNLTASPVSRVISLGWTGAVILLLSLAALGLFVVITMDVAGANSHWHSHDLQVAGQMEDHADAHSLLLNVLRLTTHSGGVPAMITLTVVGGSLLFGQKQFSVGTVWIAAALAGGIFTEIVKDSIDRHRPENPDASVVETNGSFPSGHSMGSLIGYGMLSYVLVVRMSSRRSRLLVICSFATLVLAIGMSRIYLRAHYVSDVVGGYSIGAVWLCVCVCILETARCRQTAPFLGENSQSPTKL